MHTVGLSGSLKDDPLLHLTLKNNDGIFQPGPYFPMFFVSMWQIGTTLFEIVKKTLLV